MLNEKAKYILENIFKELKVKEIGDLIIVTDDHYGDRDPWYWVRKNAYEDPWFLVNEYLINWATDAGYKV